MEQFFVGIGAQKAGTTWLAHYFKNHPEVGFSPIKELHYFDSVFRRDLVGDYFDRQAREHYQKVFSEVAGGQTDPIRLELLQAWKLRVEMIDEPRAYRQFFERLARPGCRATGEITPAYSLLEEDGFEAILSLYPTAKFIFVMRDPVERFWSHLRFEQARCGPETFLATERVIEALADPHATLRTDYQRTLECLYKVVSRNRVLVLFYEKLMDPLFHEAQIRRVTSFLGISFREGTLSEKYNEGPRVELELEQRRAISARFKHVYEYVARNFSEELPELWSMANPRTSVGAPICNPPSAPHGETT